MRRRFERNPNGSIRYWDLIQCRDSGSCPLDDPEANHAFVITSGNEIEPHAAWAGDYLASRYLACVSQLRVLGDDATWRSILASTPCRARPAIRDLRHANDPSPTSSLPARIATSIREFEEALPDEDFRSERYKLSLLFVKNIVGKPGQADRVIEFLAPDDPRAAGLDPERVAVRETERPSSCRIRLSNRCRQRATRDSGCSVTWSFGRQPTARFRATGTGSLSEERGSGTHAGSTTFDSNARQILSDTSSAQRLRPTAATNVDVASGRRV